MRNILSFLFILIFSSAYTQDSIISLDTIDSNNSLVYSNKLDKVYILKSNIIKEYNNESKEITTFSSSRFGDITSIDASNPLKILVYHYDFKNLIFLDKTLSLSGSALDLDFSDMDIKLVCSSSNSGFWAYDQTNKKLIFLNDQLKNIHNSGVISNYISGEINPIKIIERNKMVYMNNPKTGIIIFDVFGTYNKTIYIENIQDYEVIGNKLYYIKNNELHVYDIDMMLSKSITKFSFEVENFSLNRNHFYVSNNDKIIVYRVNQ